MESVKISLTSAAMALRCVGPVVVTGGVSRRERNMDDIDPNGGARAAAVVLLLAVVECLVRMAGGG